MKLRLHWTEKYEMVREYPTFELDSEKLPELEMEMLQVFNAGSYSAQSEALAALEYKMHHTELPERGETIFEMVGPHSGFGESVVYPISDEEGFLNLTGEK